MPGPLPIPTGTGTTPARRSGTRGAVPSPPGGEALPDGRTGAEHVRAYGSVAITDEGPATVFAGDRGGRLFTVTGSGRGWMSTAASWSDRFDLATDPQEFFEGISRQATDQL
ncbi:hypothetical protein GCM10023235_02390 [Kitasatospora terrestris]|uniref:DUF397 domain-containing protein n=1 Tax=Kitasatospora terrestris TaxID=258051 RepID=A0ABP9D8J9_9ACTN